MGKPKVCKYCNIRHLKQDRQITYDQYLKSFHWKNIKRAYYSSRAPKNCFICGATENLNLHHRTYKHLWKEIIGTHLNVLCRKCHLDVHFKYKKTPLRWKALKLKQRRLLREFRAGASAAHHDESQSAMQNTTEATDGNLFLF